MISDRTFLVILSQCALLYKIFLLLMAAVSFLFLFYYYFFAIVYSSHHHQLHSKLHIHKYNLQTK